METKRIKIESLLTSLLVILIIEVIMYHIVTKFKCDAMIVLGIIRIIEISLLLLVINICEGGFSSIGLNRSNAIYGLKKGIIWSLILGAATIVIFILLLAFGIPVIKMMQTRLPEGFIHRLSFFCVGGFIAPVAEEVVFRGIFYGFFRKWGVITAILLSMTIFVIAHPTGSAIPIPQIAGGIIFAAAYEREKSLITPIVIHIIGNNAIFILAISSWLVARSS